MVRKIIAGSIWSFLVMFVAAEAIAQQDVIDQRKSLMKASSAIVTKEIKRAVEEKDYATVGIKVKEVTENVNKAAKLFPKGSDAGKTRAHPDIWDKSDEFQKKLANFRDAAEALGKAAAAKDEAEVNVKFKALGTTKSGACGECHKTFRADFRKDS
jgi:cytochrome c556